MLQKNIEDHSLNLSPPVSLGDSENHRCGFMCGDPVQVTRSGRSLGTVLRVYPDLGTIVVLWNSGQISPHPMEAVKRLDLVVGLSLLGIDA